MKVLAGLLGRWLPQHEVIETMEGKLAKGG